MLDLHSALRPAAVHALGKLGEAGYHRIFVHREAGDRRASRGAVRRRRADDDETAAALGDLLVIGDHPFIDRTVRVRRADVGGHVTDPVGNLEVAYCERAEQMWVVRVGQEKGILLFRCQRHNGGRAAPGGLDVGTSPWR